MPPKKRAVKTAKPRAAAKKAPARRTGGLIKKAARKAPVKQVPLSAAPLDPVVEERVESSK